MLWEILPNARGPLIVIEFKEGTGIVAGETELKYRDITVGEVEKVGFTEGLERVSASIRVDKNVAPYIDTGSTFWIVQPEVSAKSFRKVLACALSTSVVGMRAGGVVGFVISNTPALARVEGGPRCPSISEIAELCLVAKNFTGMRTAGA